MKNMGKMINCTAKFITSSDKFRSNLNLPGDLNEKYTANLYHMITFQFYSMIFH